MLARARLESLLGRAELRPPGLPPSALLCVRRLSDPLPGALRLETGDSRPPPAWESAFVAALERALRGAARPARGPVPAGAEAVLFADRAELLACLARARRDGTAWREWWWRDLRVSPAEGGVAAAWLETPEHVPAALELLAAEGAAADVIRTLPPETTARLALSVVVVHGLPELRRAVEAARGAAAARDATAAAAGASRSAPPWSRYAPEAETTTLSATAQLLLGVSLTLRRSPQLARSASFARAALRWAGGDAGSPSTRARPRSAEQRSHALPVAPPREARGAPARAGDPAPSAPPDAPEEQRAPALLAELPQRDRVDAASTVAVESAQPSDHEPLPAARPRARRRDDATAGRRAAAPPVAPRPRVRRGAAPAAASPPTQRHETASPRGPETATAAPEPQQQGIAVAVETELGGVFYLLNFALSLGLYADFTRPLDRGLALDPWSLLAALGPQLLDEPAPRDPLWPLLARLSGGGRFRPPAAWRTPHAWLEPFEHDGVWCWSAARDTLRVLHPAGFPAVAVPRRDETVSLQLARELRRLRPIVPELQRAALRPEPSRAFERWAARLAAYADARMRRALALDADASLEHLLLRRRARIIVTATHVDVVLRLAELPLAVRYAGLDRTPGWIPAAGRVVSIHFE